MPESAVRRGPNNSSWWVGEPTPPTLLPQPKFPTLPATTFPTHRLSHNNIYGRSSLLPESQIDLEQHYERDKETLEMNRTLMNRPRGAFLKSNTSESAHLFIVGSRGPFYSIGSPS